MKIRPLREISDFVVEKLPEMLEKPSEVLVTRAAFLLQEFWHGLTLADCINGVEEKDLALLDLKMLESGIVHSGLTPPQQLSELIDGLSGSRLPSLSYEDLIFINPLHDLRLFTCGIIGETEKFFYHSHRLIEDSLWWVIRIVKKWIGLKIASEDNPIWCQVSANDIKAELSEVIKKMAALAQMPPEHFAAFRRYLTSHPVRKLKGPSGAFTARIPTLELLFRGNELPLSYTDYLTQNDKYFPRGGRRELRQAMRVVRGHRTLIETSRWDGVHDWQELKATIETLGTFFDQFRSVHLSAVAKQIPEALKGNLAGTGGESNPGEFLKKRMEETKFKK